MGTLFITIAVIIAAVFFLKGFDKVAGRGSDQIKKGIDSSKLIKGEEKRIPCPECAEMIKPKAKKCHFCGAKLKN